MTSTRLTAAAIRTDYAETVERQTHFNGAAWTPESPHLGPSSCSHEWDGGPLSCVRSSRC